MSQDTACTVCGSPTWGISAQSRIRPNEGLGWENDSTMRILDLREINGQLRLCRNCFHIIRMPTFDALALYSAEAAQIRREVYALEHPGQSPAPSPQGIDCGRHFRAVARDLDRFGQVMRFIAAHARTTFPGIGQFRILDWGGGDGYVGNLYALTLQSVTGLPAANLVYDPTPWRDGEGKCHDLAGLEGQEPFHMVIMSGIQEHTHEHVETFRLACRHLAPGGLMLCEVPDERQLAVNALVRRQRFGLHYHVCCFSRRSLHLAMEGAELGAVRTTLMTRSAYRGKPIRFFVGVGIKGLRPSGNAPARARMALSLMTFFLGMAARKAGRMLGLGTTETE